VEYLHFPGCSRDRRAEDAVGSGARATRYGPGGEDRTSSMIAQNQRPSAIPSFSRTSQPVSIGEMARNLVDRSLRHRHKEAATYRGKP
jgi:hypothetical protein